MLLPFVSLDLFYTAIGQTKNTVFWIFHRTMDSTFLFFNVILKAYHEAVKDKLTLNGNVYRRANKTQNHAYNVPQSLHFWKANKLENPFLLFSFVSLDLCLYSNWTNWESIFLNFSKNSGFNFLKFHCNIKILVKK